MSVDVLRPLLLSALATTAAGCHSTLFTGPDITTPLGAVETPPPDVYATWYAETEDCVGTKGHFDQVRWFSVPGPRWWDPIREQYAIGTWRAPHDIYIAESHRLDEDVVKHETVHELLRGGANDDPRFEACSGITH